MTAEQQTYAAVCQWSERVAEKLGLIFVQIENSDDVPVSFHVMMHFEYLHRDVSLLRNMIRPCQYRPGHFFLYIGDAKLSSAEHYRAVYVAWRTPSPTELLTQNY